MNSSHHATAHSAVTERERAELRRRRELRRPPLQPNQAYDPFGALFDERGANDDF